MSDIIERNAKCARDLLDAAAEIARLRSMMEDACKVFDHYDLPEHAFHYRRQLNAPAPSRGDSQ